MCFFLTFNNQLAQTKINQTVTAWFAYLASSSKIHFTFLRDNPLTNKLDCTEKVNVRKNYLDPVYDH